MGCVSVTSSWHSHCAWLKRSRLSHPPLGESSVSGPHAAEAAAASAPVSHQGNSEADNQALDVRSTEEYEITHLIGTGSLSRVYSAWRRRDGLEVAIKVHGLRSLEALEFGDAAWPQVRQSPPSASLVASCNIWRDASEHPNIIALKASFLEAGIRICVMEYLPSTLFHAMDMEHVLDEAVLAGYTRGMLQALRHLHENCIIHCDVKPESFMCSRHKVVKLGEFGSARRYPSSQPSDPAVGTTMFIAPEMLKGMDIDEKVDIWAMGVTLYSLFYAAIPFDVGDYTLHDMTAGILSCAPTYRSSLETLPQVSLEATAFCRALLAYHPADRLKAAELMESRFMTINEGAGSENHTADFRPAFVRARELGIFGAAARGPGLFPAQEERSVAGETESTAAPSLSSLLQEFSNLDAS